VVAVSFPKTPKPHYKILKILNLEFAVILSARMG